MHGKLKVRTTAEQQEIKQKERAKKLDIYRTVIERVFNKRKNAELDDEILTLTGKLLVENPDIYTLWNIRKETILKIKETNLNIDDYVSKELAITEQCIRVNPKSYNSWFHRKWIMDQGSTVDYNNELKLCDKCLSLDDRNFHCWDYRRIVVDKSGTPPEKELEFSTERILKNFSNYSSWHYRSKLLPKIYPSHEKNSKISTAKLVEECNLVQNALFTDPNDQSGWFYQRWLLFPDDDSSTELSSEFLSICKNELESCRQLYDLEPNNKWVILRICQFLQLISRKENIEEISQLIEKLHAIDPLRKGFYQYWSLKVKEWNC